MSVTSKFTGAVRHLTKTAEERSEKYRGNSEFQRLLNFQRRLADGVEGLESLSNEGGEGEAEILRFAEKFKNSLPGISNEFTQAAAQYNSSMLQAAYEHSGLIPGAHDEEIRSVFRNLSTVDKFSFIVKAMEEKNGGVLAAILHGGVPAVLVGLTPEMKTKYRDDFFKFTISDFVETWDNYKDLHENVSTTYQVAQDAARTYSDEGKLTSLTKAQEMQTAAKSKLDGGTL